MTLPLIFIEGFDHYGQGSSSLIREMWSANPAPLASVNLSSGRFFGGAMTGTGTNTQYPAKTFTQNSSWLIGFAMMVHNPPAGIALLRIIDDATTQVTLRLETNGALMLYRGPTATNLLSAGSTILAQRQWYYVELAVDISNTGVYELRISADDSSPVAEFSGSADTQNSGNSFANILSFGTENIVTIDDVYVKAGNVAFVAGDFMFDSKVTTQWPRRDGLFDEWTPSPATPSPFENVDETLHNQDTDYIFSNTPAHESSFFMTSYVGPNSIKGLQVVASTRVLTTAANTLKILLIASDGVVFYGNEFTPETSYRFAHHLWELNPSNAVYLPSPGSTPWGGSEIDLTTGGVRLHS